MASGPHTPGAASAPARERAAVRRQEAERAAARRPRRRRRRRRERSGSDLGARVLAAVPAIAIALFLVIEGGVVFAFGVFVFGCACMHELYAMYERARPARLAGYLALAGLLAAASASAAPPPTRLRLLPNAIAFRDRLHGVLGTGYRDETGYRGGAIETTSDGGRTWRVA
ncbi:MAG TPA: hypothetical protein VKV16_11970, partial [Solirubrobacteraceae bacterium]|nr:hypothetical protein [Solirubrobacteraceae bacterium]